MSETKEKKCWKVLSHGRNSAYVSETKLLASSPYNIHYPLNEWVKGHDNSKLFVFKDEIQAHFFKTACHGGFVVPALCRGVTENMVEVNEVVEDNEIPYAVRKPIFIVNIRSDSSPFDLSEFWKNKNELKEPTGITRDEYGTWPFENNITTLLHSTLLADEVKCLE